MANVLRIGKRQWLLAFVSGVALAGLVVAGCSDDAGLSPLGGPAGDPGPALAAKLQADTGKTWIVDVDPQLGTPDLLEPKDDPAPVLTNGTTPEAAALAFLERYQASFGTSTMRSELRMVETDVDEDGLTHVRFEQVSGNLPVFGEGLSVHFTKEGAIAFVNGRFVPNLAQLSKVPARTAEIARADAVTPYPGATAKDVTLGIDGAFGKAAKLAYRVRVEGTSGKKPLLADLFVDAQSGAVVAQESRIHTERGSGRGVRGYAPFNEGDTKTFEVDRNYGGGLADGGVADGGPRVGDAGAGDAGSANGYALKLPRTNQASVVEVSSELTHSLVTSPTPDAWDVLPTSQNGNGAAVDSYVNMNLVDVFYRTSFRWRSYDNKGSNLRVFVHDNSAGDANAFWNGSELHFGDGDAQSGGNYVPLTNLDVVAHELSHGVTEYTSKLFYGGESGALNESASDVFACILEHERHPNLQQNLLFGEQSTKDATPLRDMRHPQNQGQPDHVDAQVSKGVPSSGWNNGNDHGGVHTNSGIANNAFALMVEGGQHDTSRVIVPIGGWELGKRIAWFAQRYNDRTNTQFYAHARWQIAAAKKVRVTVEPVACAWVAVGVMKADYVKRNYNVTCEVGCEGGTCDAGASDAKADRDLRDSCQGRADGVYCSEIADFSSIVCKNQAIASGQQCPSPQKCVGPNGPGTTIQCK
jgi:Zn-dependent metalloprotease